MRLQNRKRVADGWNNATGACKKMKGEANSESKKEKNEKAFTFPWFLSLFCQSSFSISLPPYNSLFTEACGGFV